MASTARERAPQHRTDRRDARPVGDEDRLRLRRAVEDERAPRPREPDARPDREAEEIWRSESARDEVQADLEVVVFGIGRERVRPDEGLAPDRKEGGDELPGPEGDPRA